MFLDSYPMIIACPHCGKKHQKTVGWIKANANFPCDCGVNIVLAKEQFMREIESIEQRIDSITPRAE